MNYRNGLVMNFPVKELVERLTINRDEHLKIITEAKKNYLIALQTELASKLDKLLTGNKINPNSNLPVPGDNLDEYDTAINMLEFTTNTEIELTQHQYHCYVEDKWDWQENFLTTISSYSETAVNKLKG